ncbi:MAG: HAD-IB family hydrolase [Acidimicrobiales bacterium]
MSDQVGVAAFDFDGTITERDTLLGFLEFVGGRRRVASALAAQSPTLARGLRSSEARNTAKERVLGQVLRGRAVDDVTDAGIRYAATLPTGFRRETLQHIASHRAADHRLVIVSASLVYYLRPIAADLGFEDVIAVEMSVGDDDRLTGTLTTPNVRREHKATRLQAWLDERLDGATPELWAYGDSSGDDHLLAMADHATWIGRRARRGPAVSND